MPKIFNSSRVLFQKLCSFDRCNFYVKRKAIPAQDQKKMYIFLNIYFIKEEYQKDKNS